jgi:hypothetical protein
MNKWLKIALVGASLVVLTTAGYAAVAPNPVSEIGNLLKTNQYDLARQRITEYLDINPNDINVLMMQGNLILNEQLATGVANFTVLNESIYQKTNGYIQPAPLVIPQPLAQAVAEPWRKCLELEPGRTEIREGLAYLYAQAGMKTELLALLPDLQADATEPTETKYLMCTLAGMLAERNILDAAIEVYQAVMGLYPDEPVVYAELADALLQHGRLTEAKQYLAAGAVVPGPDKRQFYWTSFKVEATLGNYPQALTALQDLDRLTHKKDYQFYQGLLSYCHNKPQWSREMRNFLAAPSDVTDPNHRGLARFMLSKENRHDYASYLKCLRYKVDAGFLLLLHQRAMALFPNQAGPVINYAEFHNIHHHYAETLRVLTPWEARPFAGPELTEAFLLQYAWALQSTAELAKANQYWLKLFNAKDFYIKSAAIYFYGKNFCSSGRQPEAARFFKMIAGEPARSKYAFYSQRMLLQMERETTPVSTPLETPTLAVPAPSVSPLPRL